MKNYYLKIKGRGLVNIKITPAQAELIQDLIDRNQGEFESINKADGFTPPQNPIEWTRVNSDVNGNPRYVCHFLDLLTSEERKNYPIFEQYDLAIFKAKKIGGRKFSNKQYGGGIVFQSYNIQDTEKQIKELLNN